MTPAVGILILEAALKWGPNIALEISNLFSSPSPTLEDWITLLNKVKSYEQMDAESKARVAAK